MYRLLPLEGVLDRVFELFADSISRYIKLMPVIMILLIAGIAGSIGNFV